MTIRWMILCMDWGFLCCERIGVLYSESSLPGWTFAVRRTDGRTSAQRRHIALQSTCARPQVATSCEVLSGRKDLLNSYRRLAPGRSFVICHLAGFEVIVQCREIRRRGCRSSRRCWRWAVSMILRLEVVRLLDDVTPLRLAASMCIPTARRLSGPQWSARFAADDR